MATVRADLKNGHRLSSVFRGDEALRVYYVTGLVGPPEDQLREAINDPGVPKLSDQYPNVPTLRVLRVDATPGGENAARVEVFYGVTQNTTFNQPIPTGDGSDVKQFSSAVESSRTIQDRSNNPMVISAPANYSTWGDYVSVAEILTPRHTLMFERSESVPPTQRSRDLVGKVNQFALGSYPVNSLLFARLDAQSDDGGRVWRVTYEFRYSPDLWRHFDTYKGPSGKAVSGGTLESFDVYQQASFAGLGLDFGDSQTPI